MQVLQKVINRFVGIIYILILFAIFNFRCIQTEKASGDFNRLLDQKTNTLNKGIKFSGAYHHITDDSYHYPTDYKNGLPTRYIDTPYLEQPLFFFEDGSLLFEYGTTTLEAKDLNLSDDQYKKNFYNEKGWGVYDIKNDTINGIIYVNFLTGWFYTATERLQCHFQGIIKDPDTILHWQLVPPYPKFNKKKSDNFKTLKLLETPVDLYFKEMPEKKLIDPRKAWIKSTKNKITL